jgi:hypothetical protein
VELIRRLRRDEDLAAALGGEDPAGSLANPRLGQSPVLDVRLQ